jgi:integrase
LTRGRRLYVCPRSGGLSRSLPALKAAGLSGVHFHDLRHTGNQFVANKGANTRELMERMGHDSERAAMIYLHSSTQRQRDLADAVGDAVRAELAKSKPRKAAKPSGTRRARTRRSGAGSAE